MCAKCQNFHKIVLRCFVNLAPGYVRFLLYLFYVLFVLDKLTNRWINHVFRWRCLTATVNIRSNPNHSNKNSFVSNVWNTKCVSSELYQCNCWCENRVATSGKLKIRTNYGQSVLDLSLIHIWRCRRIERCRSRWSPYH